MTPVLQPGWIERPRRRSPGLWVTAVLVASMGVINLLSAITPGLTERVQVLEAFYPVEIRSSAHLLAALAGFFLLILASSLLRRKRTAWILTLVLLSTSILSHLIKGLDLEESLVAAGLMLLLIVNRKLYTAQSDRPSIAAGVKALVASLLFTLVYGTVGFFLLVHSFTVQFDLPEAAAQTLAMFFTQDNAGLTPINRFGQFFADSIFLVGGATLLYALVMLLRPVLLRGDSASAEQRGRAISIVQEHGQTSLAHYTLLKDKSYFFSPSGRSMIAYVLKGNGAIALGDPIGPDDDCLEAIEGFHHFCRRNDWDPGFYQTGPEHLALYERIGFHAVKIGEEAIIDLRTFSLKGKDAQNLRTPMNKLKKLGHHIDFAQPPLSPGLMQELRSVRDEWLTLMQGSEKAFSVGWFDEDYIRNCEVAVVRTEDGTISAFANVVPGYRSNQITIDLMRHCKGMVNGTMDALFCTLFQHFKDRGFEGFNLGLSALSGVGGSTGSTPLERGIHYLYQHLNQFYNFKGLHAYKAKFKPRWEPRYIVFPTYAALPGLVVALVRADSGDGLLDYFKPGS